MIANEPNDDVKRECELLIKRARLAYNYLMGTLRGFDLYDMCRELEDISEVYPCVSLSSEEVVEEFLERHYEIEDPSGAIYSGDIPKELLDKLWGYANTAASETAGDFEYRYYSELRGEAVDSMEKYMKDDDYEPPGELGIQAMLASEKEDAGK